MTEEQSIFDSINKEKPEEIKDFSDIVKGTFKCSIDVARVEEGNFGKSYFMQLKVIDDPAWNGKSFWDRYSFNSEARMKRLRNTIWTLIGEEVNSEDDLANVSEKLINLAVKVRAFSKKKVTKNESTGEWEQTDDMVQGVSIQGLAKDTKSTESPAF